MQRKKEINTLKNHLRRVSMYQKAVNNVRNASRVWVENGKYKNGKTKYKRLFECAHCGEYFEEIEIDHIVEVNQLEMREDAERKGWYHVDWQGYIDRLLVTEDDLQALCRECHYVKTQRFNEQIRTGIAFL